MKQAPTLQVALRLALAVCGLSLCLTAARADVRLPAVIDSNMVLQRDQPITIWGWASPGEAVTVELAGQTQSTEGADDGSWSVELSPLQVGDPLTLKVTGKNTISLDNILVGEVWVCSGQSNMEWSVARADNPEKEIAEANYPNIRLFHIPKDPAGTPQDDVNADWKVCTPENIPGFSAVAYFFGRKLNQDLGVPIGLINTSWGGTRIEPWTTEEGFRAVPAVADIADSIDEKKASYRKAEEATVAKVEQWLAESKQAVADGAPLTPPPAWPGHPLDSHGQPTGLYNGMVHPIRHFAVAGAIWYQGESNRGDGMLYFEKMKALIHAWRTAFDHEDLPFLFVQLAPYRYDNNDAALAELWQSQLTTVRKVDHTGMAVTTDIGNVSDIHPTNKQEVGRRLALWALAETYGRDDLVYSGPLYKSMSVEDDKIRLSFEHVGDGLVAAGDKPLSYFTIAGEDGNFVEATAEIDGETVVVSSPEVEKPVAVRFGWTQLAEPNFKNSAGLPASPFRTDGPQ